jgi:hypothetical protein
VRGPILFDCFEREADKHSSVFGRVGDGGGAENELRRCPVKLTKTTETPQDVGDVGAENTPINVGFVYDHEAEIVEKAGPSLVVGQDAEVQHIRVAQNDACLLFNGGSLVCRSVTIKGGAKRGVGEFAETSELVLGESLGREEIERPGGG